MIPINLVYDPDTGRLVYDPATGRLVCAGSGDVKYWIGEVPNHVRNGWTFRKQADTAADMKAAAWAQYTGNEISTSDVRAALRAYEVTDPDDFYTDAVCYALGQYVAVGTDITKLTVSVLAFTPSAHDIRIGWRSTNSNTPSTDDWDWVEDAPSATVNSTGDHVLQVNLTADAYLWIFVSYAAYTPNKQASLQVQKCHIEI